MCRVNLLSNRKMTTISKNGHTFRPVVGTLVFCAQSVFLARKLSNIVVNVNVTYFNSVFVNFCAFSAMSPKKPSSDSTGINFNALIDAIKRCITDKQPIKTTAKTFGLPRSTLQRYLKKVGAKFDDLSSVEDGVLLGFVRDCSQRTPSNMVCLFYFTREA